MPQVANSRLPTKIEFFKIIFEISYLRELFFWRPAPSAAFNPTSEPASCDAEPLGQFAVCCTPGAGKLRPSALFSHPIHLCKKINK
jgi:hypothetical protein